MIESNPISTKATSVALPFRAVVTPHRSLPKRGFVLLMLAFGLASFTAGVVFVLKGAWPVFGFLGLDVGLLWLAFHLNYRRGTNAEIIDVDRQVLTVCHQDRHGARKIVALDPYWARLERADNDDLGTTTLHLAERGRRVEIGSVLSHPEKHSLALAIGEALRLVRTAT